MSSVEQIPLTIELLEKKLQIKCSADNVETLQEAAKYLDNRLKEIRDAGKAVGMEKIAVMAALNIAYELLNLQQQRELYVDTMSNRIKHLQKKIEEALANQG